MEEELELLQEIFIDELRVETRSNKETILKISLTPSTGGRWDEKYVFLDLVIALDPTVYPNAVPSFSLHTVRGVSDEHQARILSELNVAANDKLGECMLYDLIQFVQETLTDNNMPAGNCPICLESFEGYCHFTITECTHYFHMACLNEHLRHVDATEDKEARCPSCRDILDPDFVDALQRNTKELGLKCNLHKPDSESIFLDQNILRAQDKYQEAYKRQEANNSFFTGEESHVLDLRTAPRAELTPVTRVEPAPPVTAPRAEPPRVAASRVEEPSRSTLLEASLPARRDKSRTPPTQRLVRDSDAGSSAVEEATEDEETEKKAAANSESEDNTSLIISFSSLLESNPDTPLLRDMADPLTGDTPSYSGTPEPRNDYNQVTLGSTGSTAPSITPLEDSQSEASLLSHDEPMLDSPCLISDSPLPTDSPCLDSPLSSSNLLTNDSPTNNRDDLCYTDEEYNTEDLVRDDVRDDMRDEVRDDMRDEVRDDMRDDMRDDVRDDVAKEETTDEARDEEPRGNGLPCVSSGEEDEVTAPLEAAADSACVGEVKEVTFNLPEKEGEKKESCTTETQTRRPKRNRNKKRGEQGEKKNYRNDKGEGSERGTQKRGQYNQRRPPYQPKHNNYQNSQATSYNNNQAASYNNQAASYQPANSGQQEGEVCYRQNRGGARANRANCRSYHEDMAKQQQGGHVRRHSFTGQESFGVPRGPAMPGPQQHGVPHGPPQHAQGQDTRGKKFNRRGNEQPRFKPPRILRQEALEQARKVNEGLDHDQTYNKPVMHKQALGGYHPASNQHSSQHSNQHSNQHSSQHSSQSHPPHSSAGPTSTQASRALSPNSQKIFDVARFQQSVLRNNIPKQ